MSKINDKAFETIYGLYNEDIISSADYNLIADALNETETLQDRDAVLETLWNQFGDVPMNPETECIEEEFLGFPAGTHREDIWHWFDERYSKGIAYLLYGGSEDYVPETKRLYALKKLCSECESHDCQFNHNGECRVALVHEREPRITDEDGCLDYNPGGAV